MNKIENGIIEIKMSTIKQDLKGHTLWAYENSPMLASLMDYTKESPCLIAVAMALEKCGYQIKYE